MPRPSAVTRRSIARADRSATRLRGPARILVAANEPIEKMVQMTLDHGVFETHVAGTTAEAHRKLAEVRPHLVIVDLDLSGENGMSLIGLRNTENGGGTIPTIAMTRRGDVRTKLAAFEAGVDDLITVPAIPEELVARVVALMRRTYGHVVQFVPEIKVRDIRIDLLTQRVRAGDRRLELTALEQALLYLLASNAGRVVSRGEILDSLWGRDFVSDSNIVDRHVRNLRVKLHDSWRSPRYIETVSGAGYRFIDSEVAAD